MAIIFYLILLIATISVFPGIVLAVLHLLFKANYQSPDDERS